MTINVNICVESPAEYLATLTALLAGVSGTKPASTPQAGGVDPAPEKFSTGKKADGKKADAPAGKPAETPTASAPAATEKAYTLADIAEIVPKCASKDRTRTVELLGKYGAKRGGELKATDYAAFIADANAFLAE